METIRNKLPARPKDFSISFHITSFGIAMEYGRNTEIIDALLSLLPNSETDLDAENLHREILSMEEINDQWVNSQYVDDHIHLIFTGKFSLLALVLESDRLLSNRSLSNEIGELLRVLVDNSLKTLAGHDWYMYCDTIVDMSDVSDIRHEIDTILPNAWVFEQFREKFTEGRIKEALHAHKTGVPLSPCSTSCMIRRILG